MVYTDPSDWYRDLQLMFDVVISRGVPGRRLPPADAPPVEGARAQPAGCRCRRRRCSMATPECSPAPCCHLPAVFFSNPDLLWGNEFSAPRFGQGAFAACLDALHRRVRAGVLGGGWWAR